MRVQLKNIPGKREYTYTDVIQGYGAGFLRFLSLFVAAALILKQSGEGCREEKGLMERFLAWLFSDQPLAGCRTLSKNRNKDRIELFIFWVFINIGLRMVAKVLQTNVKQVKLRKKE